MVWAAANDAGSAAAPNVQPVGGGAAIPAGISRAALRPLPPGLPEYTDEELRALIDAELEQRAGEQAEIDVQQLEQLLADEEAQMLIEHDCEEYPPRLHEGDRVAVHSLSGQHAYLNGQCGTLRQFVEGAVWRCLEPSGGPQGSRKASRHLQTPQNRVRRLSEVDQGLQTPPDTSRHPNRVWRPQGSYIPLYKRFAFLS